MDQWILEIMNSYGYLGMALLILGENLFPPIPSEVILTFGGFMTSYTQMHIPGAVLSATAGSVAGAVILYQIGSFLTPEKLDGLLSGRAGKILGLKKENLRDNMSDLELVLTMLAEASTRDISQTEKPHSFTESQEIARRGGKVAGIARQALEAETGKPVVTAQNATDFQRLFTDIVEDAAALPEQKEKRI